MSMRKPTYSGTGKSTIRDKLPKVNRVVRRPFFRERLSMDFSKGGRTHQSFAEDCDINTIVQRYERTGVMPPARQGVYADVSGFSGDMTEMLVKAGDTIQSANDFLAKRSEDAKEAERKAQEVKEVKPPEPPATEQPASQ